MTAQRPQIFEQTEFCRFWTRHHVTEVYRWAVWFAHCMWWFLPVNFYFPLLCPFCIHGDRLPGGGWIWRYSAWTTRGQKLNNESWCEDTIILTNVCFYFSWVWIFSVQLDMQLSVLDIRYHRVKYSWERLCLILLFRSVTYHCFEYRLVNNQQFWMDGLDL